MYKKLNNLSSDELYILIGKNVARLRKKSKLSQLALSLEMGNKSTSLLSSAEVYKNKRKCIKRKDGREMYGTEVHPGEGCTGT